MAAENSLDFLDDIALGITPEPETPGETVAQPIETTPDAPAAEPVLEPAAATAREPGFVPLSGLLDEREKRQAATRRADELEAKLKSFEQPQRVPDVTSDPAGWQAQQEQRFEHAKLDLKMEMSGRYAAQTFGQDVVQTAMAWGKDRTAADPFFGQKFLQSPDPFGFLVAEHRRANALGKLGDKSPEDWAIEYAQSQGWAKPIDAANSTQQSAPAIAVAQPLALSPPSPPRSIASAPPAGRSNAPVLLSDQDIFAQVVDNVRKR